MENNYNKEQRLKKRLLDILKQQDLALHQTFLLQLSTELEISVLECAAALSYLAQSELGVEENRTTKSNGQQIKVEKDLNEIVLRERSTSIKLVKYRLSVGRKHKVSFDQLKSILVDISGVEKKSIGKLDIRNHYTLVELPDGMPADIFQLLSETEIDQQKLNIKRIKQQRRFYRRNSKNNR